MKLNLWNVQILSLQHIPEKWWKYTNAIYWTNQRNDQFTVIVQCPSLSPFPPPPQIRTPYRLKHLQRPASTFLNLSYIDLNDHGKPEVWLWCIKQVLSSDLDWCCSLWSSVTMAACLYVMYLVVSLWSYP